MPISIYSHPLPVGFSALVYGIVLAEPPKFEGRALILGPVEGEPDLYRVCFQGERVHRHRVVHAGVFQSEAQACLSTLQRQWESNVRRDEFLDWDLSLHNSLSVRAPLGRKLGGK